MKKVIITAAMAVLCCSCGSTRTSSIPEYQQEVHDIGYTSILEDQQTNSTSRISTRKKKEAITYTNMYDYLRGRVPGLSVGADNSIIIRGQGSNSYTPPLVLLDGVEVTDLSNVDPEMVDYVEIIKDGSTAIYGMRGSNGVILITTKR